MEINTKNKTMNAKKIIERIWSLTDKMRKENKILKPV